MRIIAFAGPAGAGKSTLAHHLVTHYGYKRCSFAAPLYDMLEAGGFGRPKTLEEKEAVILALGFSWRYAAQTLGTQWGRTHLGTDIWVKLALQKLRDADGLYVIDDLRFDNEAKTLRELGAAIIHIESRRGDIRGSSHESEQGIMREIDDWFLDNSGPLEQTYSNLNLILGQLALQ